MGYHRAPVLETDLKYWDWCSRWIGMEYRGGERVKDRQGSERTTGNRKPSGVTSFKKINMEV